MSLNAPESLAEQIASHITEQIIRGHLASNERIQEARVVEELQVSRGPVREALLILESRHLVTIVPRRGAMVSELTPNRVHGLYDIYETLLTLLATRVAQVWTDENKTPLLNQAMALQQIATTADKYQFMLAGFDLMWAACEMVDNAYLANTLRSLQPAIHRTYALSIRHSPTEIDTTKEFFVNVVTAILSRDTASLPSLMHKFSNNQRLLVLSAMEHEGSSCA
ncbi:MAG: GntR family transcriptional regulator [Oleibacter sp.]|nr:GntR family transcriptional regulator [Thalassolituus sp.]